MLGWAQVPGIDCCGTIAADLDYEGFILDVQTAFLNADVEEEVSIKMAPGYETYDKPGGPFVMKLKKSLYGLPQSPKNLFGPMDDHLSSIGFRSLKSDPCVYVFEDKTNTAILTFYVDDILLLGNNKQLLDKLKKQLMDRFEMTVSGTCQRCSAWTLLR